MIVVLQTLLLIFRHENQETPVIYPDHVEKRYLSKVLRLAGQLNTVVLMLSGYYCLFKGRTRALDCFSFTVTNAPSFSCSSNCLKDDKTTAVSIFGDTSWVRI